LGLALKKEYREEGIGAELMKVMLQIAQRFSIQMIQLSVYSPNTLAYGLYTKLGFQEVGRIPNKVLFHGELVEEVIMIRSL